MQDQPHARLDAPANLERDIKWRIGTMSGETSSKTPPASKTVSTSNQSTSSGSNLVTILYIGAFIAYAIGVFGPWATFTYSTAGTNFITGRLTFSSSSVTLSGWDMLGNALGNLDLLAAATVLAAILAPALIVIAANGDDNRWKGVSLLAGLALIFSFFRPTGVSGGQSFIKTSPLSHSTPLVVTSGQPQFGLIIMMFLVVIAGIIWLASVLND